MLTGVLLGVLAFLGAWWLAKESSARLGIDSDDGTLISSMAGACCEDHLPLRLRALETYAHVKAISNQQSIGVLAIGAGMSFLSIGFSLFLVGAEGAFKLRASGRGGDDKIMLYGTAPGLLAFALAAMVIVVGATRKHEMSFTAEFGPSSSVTTPNATASQDCPTASEPSCDLARVCSDARENAMSHADEICALARKLDCETILSSPDSTDSEKNDCRSDLATTE